MCGNACSNELHALKWRRALLLHMKHCLKALDPQKFCFIFSLKFRSSRSIKGDEQKADKPVSCLLLKYILIVSWSKTHDIALKKVPAKLVIEKQGKLQLKLRKSAGVGPTGYKSPIWATSGAMVREDSTKLSYSCAFYPYQGSLKLNCLPSNIIGQFKHCTQNFSS